MKSDQKKISKDNEVPANNSGVIKANLQRFILAGTILYTVLILYFMFFGFNRLGQRAHYNAYEFLLVPEGVPLRFPSLTLPWLVDFGNIAAFIPFGILIPLLYHIRFRKFIVLFISAISSLEVLQSLTFLGTFDVMDIISNTLGAIIGFVAYKVGFSKEITAKKLVASAAAVLVLIVGIMIVSETIDYGVHVNERIGPVHALNEFSTGTPIPKELPTFTVEGETVQPKFNYLSAGDEAIQKYIVHVGKKNLWLYADCGFPDEEAYHGSVTFMINGEEFLRFSDQDKDSHLFQLKTFLEAEVKDVEIIVTGNAKVWDVSMAEIKHWWE